METTYSATVPGIGTFEVPATTHEQARDRIVEFLADGLDSDIGAIHVDPRFVVVVRA